MSQSPDKVFKVYFKNQSTWPKEWRELTIQAAMGLYTNKELLKHGIRNIAEELVIEHVEKEIEYGPQRTSQDANGAWYIVQSPTGASRDVITFVSTDDTRFTMRTKWTKP